MPKERKVLVYGASGYTGKIISECLAQRDIPFYMAGYQSAAQAFGHRQLLETFNKMGYCNLPD